MSASVCVCVCGENWGGGGLGVELANNICLRTDFTTRRTDGGDGLRTPPRVGPFRDYDGDNSSFGAKIDRFPFRIWKILASFPT